MFATTHFKRFTTSLLLGILVLVAADAAKSQTANRAIPKWAVIEQAVKQYFQTVEDYQDGDWITQNSVRPLLARLKTLGLPLPDAAQILADTPTSDEYLTQQLSRPAGRKFMREIASYPNAFDRLDRISRLSNGRKLVQELIRGPDGYKMIEYMTTASGGRELGRMVSKSPGGANFNAPTGRIYTAKILLDRLEESWDASMNPGKKQR